MDSNRRNQPDGVEYRNVIHRRCPANSTTLFSWQTVQQFPDVGPSWSMGVEDRLVTKTMPRGNSPALDVPQLSPQPHCRWQPPVMPWLGNQDSSKSLKEENDKLKMELNKSKSETTTFKMKVDKKTLENEALKESLSKRDSEANSLVSEKKNHEEQYGRFRESTKCTSRQAPSSKWQANKQCNTP